MSWMWVLLAAVVGVFTIGTIAVWGDRDWAGHGRRYRALAERSEASRRETADTLTELREWMTSVDGRLVSLNKRLAEVEKLLREVS